MAIEISKGKWSVETGQGLTFFRISSQGIHVQVTTNLPNNMVKVFDEKLVPFSKVQDLAVGQAQLV